VFNPIDKPSDFRVQVNPVAAACQVTGKSQISSIGYISYLKYVLEH
jgi:hypothetical protein